MTKAEALKLLRGGHEGIAEWNHRRLSGEEIPSLSNADLRRADLSERSGAVRQHLDRPGEQVIEPTQEAR